MNQKLTYGAGRALLDARHVLLRDVPGGFVWAKSDEIRFSRHRP